MTTTQVKDAGSILNIQTQAFAAANRAAGASKVSFQNVLNGQTGKKSETGQPRETGRTKKTDNDHFKVNDRETSPKAKQLDGSNRGKDQVRAQETKNKDGMASLTDSEETMEVLAGAAMQIAELITEVFGISAEELENLMEEMDLSDISLLNVKDLGALLLKAGGADNQAQLLMDGDLYEKFNTVMNGQEEILLSESGVGDLNVEELVRIAGESRDEDITPAIDSENTDVPKTAEPERKTFADALSVQDDILEAAKDSEETTKQPAAVRENGGERSVSTEEYATDDGQTLGVKAMVESAEDARSDSEAGRGRRESEREGRQNGNPAAFAQRTENFGSNFETEAVADPQGGFTTSTQNIMRQIMDYMRVQVRPETTNLEMQLHPASLGTIHIQLQSKGGMVTANFIAQNESVKAALESQIVQLRENFEEQGVKVEAVEVTVETHQFEQNLEQNNRGQNDAESSVQRGRRVRRLNLDQDPEELEALDEADRIAAQMMEANGNTVDYTA